MALLFMDGFDHYGNAADPSTLLKWLSAVGSPSTQLSPRTGTHSFRASSTTALTSKIFTFSGGIIVGLAWNTPSFAAGDIIRIQEGATIHVTVACSVTGVLTVKRGTTIIATGTTVLTINNWYYIELKTVIHDTTGTFEVRINGVVEAALNLTGQDTRNGGTGVCDRISVCGAGGGANNYIDDVYLCDTSGSAPRNDFLGTVKIETMYPQTDAVAAGSNAGLTPSTGTDHGALVDEATPNTSDYNSSPTVGLKDTYNYPAMALTGTVYGIQTNLYVQKSDAAARQVCAVVRSGGADYDGANVSPTTTFGYFSEIRAQDPNGSIEWTTGNIASIQAGMKVTA